MKKDPSTPGELSPYKIAATYIGTIIGAGFASGQEVLQFFGHFGLWGIIGLAIAAILFAMFGYAMLELGRRLRANSHLPVIKHAGGCRVGVAIDGVITFFLFGGVGVMAAGSGAIFAQEYGMSALLGNFAMLAITLVTVLVGISGVISAMSFLVPVLVAAILVIGSATVTANPAAFWGNLDWFQPGRAAVPFWLLSALLYVSYNLVIGVAVLAPLGPLTSQAKLRSGAIWGGAGLGIGALAITAALITHMPAASRYEVPMLFIADEMSPVFRSGYGVVLLVGIFTTAVGSLYGFCARLTSPGTRQFRWLAVGTSLASFFTAQVGFSRLVGILFPLVGFAGLLLLGAIANVMTRDYRANLLLRLGIKPAYKKGAPVTAARPYSIDPMVIEPDIERGENLEHTGENQEDIRGEGVRKE